MQAEVGAVLLERIDLKVIRKLIGLRRINREKITNATAAGRCRICLPRLHTDDITAIRPCRSRPFGFLMIGVIIRPAIQCRRTRRDIRQIGWPAIVIDETLAAHRQCAATPIGGVDQVPCRTAIFRIRLDGARQIPSRIIFELSDVRGAARF